ncbi:MAG TPA: septum formation initiator family protein [Nocardioidaceae bacterium]|nr:septum formation initiator family protein [Nocardioidaceae bacterium]
MLLFVVLAMLLVSYASSMRAWLDQRAHIDSLEQQIAADRASVERLTNEKRRWNDPAYVKAQARERFGYVLPGTVGYRVIGEDGEPLGGTGELSEPTPAVEEQVPPWWDQAWGSVEAAGAGSEESEEESPARFIGPTGQTR